ncbi:hypothetical protein SLS63_007571 [Diaporthe eres]|uniref:DUF7082 domain-containing protein n=1 Tax=Diaporthe eres TaxID=83184 RepID=A0ABR1P538_DIAER
MHGFSESSYNQYSPQNLPQAHLHQQSENAAAQMNQMAYAANNAAVASNNRISYNFALAPSGFSAQGSQPDAGPGGTKIHLRISGQYDILSVTSTAPYVWVLFGNAAQKSPAQMMKESQDATGACTYSITVDAPPFVVTDWQASSTVPLTVVIENPCTNNYGYPSAAVAPSQSQVQVPQAQPTTSFGASAYGQSNDTMLHAYRTSNYSHTQHHYQRSPTSLRSPHHGLGGWATYGGLDGRTSTYSSAHHTTITRPSLHPSLPMPSGGPPTLVRTTSIPQGTSSMGLGGSYSPFVSHHKAILHIQGNLESMTIGWTPEEWENRRRIVMFKKSQSGSRLTATFRAVPVNERPPNSICVSCIWWEERHECFVTSVDTIHLLEQLVVSPNRFTVEEKNRIRRNLEGFKPLTVSKAKADSEDFFKIIMGFGNPKPRNIEKDVKVFPWKVLAPALKKIIGKYSASPSSTRRIQQEYQATSAVLA